MSLSFLLKGYDCPITFFLVFLEVFRFNWFLAFNFNDTTILHQVIGSLYYVGFNFVFG